MLKAVQINSTNVNNKELQKIYESAFTGGERHPYPAIIRIITESGENCDYTAYYDGDLLVGLTMVCILKRFTYGAYFAVREDLRGKGYGQTIFTSVLEKYSKSNPFVIDAESPLEENAPNLEIRKRRYAFFIRNGLRDTGVRTNYNGVLFNFLSNSNEPFSQKDFDEINATLPE